MLALPAPAATVSHVTVATESPITTATPVNVAQQLWERVEASGPREALRYPRGESWESLTWAQVGQRVSALAGGLLALGVAQEERVGILCSTRHEWLLVDLAVMAAGAATTTVYPSTNAEDTAYILSDSGCGVVVAEDESQLAKLRERRSELPDLRQVVLVDGEGDGDWVIGLDELARRGKEHLSSRPDALKEIAAAVPGDQLATLIYTSGTTGKPKGVRLRHSSWVFEGESNKAVGTLSEEDLQYLWLPMAHSFGKVLLSAQLAVGFATAVDGRVDKIVDNLAVVKPTFMGAAPRIFEKAYGRVVTTTEAEGGAKKKIFDWAFGVGREVKAREAEGRGVPLPLRLQHGLADKLVFSKVRDRFGGRIRFFISGSAALNTDVAQWFDTAGLTIYEGYGLTETSAGACVNTPENHRIGTVGPPLPGVQVRIGEGDEVQINGPGVMDGYHNLPDKTAESFTSDGWFRTGDKGSLDEDGLLRITGRLKELFKTSGGKYVSPGAVESRFKGICPYASQMIVFGEGHNYCVALVTLDPDAIAGWAQEKGINGDYATIVSSPQCREMVQGYVDELNAGLNRWETVKKFAILDHDLSIDSGELTPSLKVKRNVVADTNADVVERLYAS